MAFIITVYLHIHRVH